MPTNPKAATPATPAKKATVPAHLSSTPKPRQNTEYDIPANEKAPPTEAEKAAKKASEESTKIEAAAAEKAGKINASLVKKGDPRRVMGGVRGGKEKFFWCNTVPTAELTEDDAKAAEAL